MSLYASVVRCIGRGNEEGVGGGGGGRGSKSFFTNNFMISLLDFAPVIQSKGSGGTFEHEFTTFQKGGTKCVTGMSTESDHADMPTEGCVEDSMYTL